MKKLVLAIFTMFLFSYTAKAADPTVVSLGSQVDAFLATVGTAGPEFTTKGLTKMVALDGLVGIGKYKANLVDPYYLVIDGGIIQSSDQKSTIGATIGVHANVLQYAGTFLTLSPSAAAFWQYLNLTPRASFDSDVHEFVYGATAGFSVPFK